jgi:cytochrome c biogenesis protein CcdA
MIRDVSIPAALTAGIISFLSPSVLPLVPPYLIYPTGATIEHVANDKAASASRCAVAMSAAMFVLGFSTVFVAVGAGANLIGAAGLGIPFLLAALMIEQFSSLLVRLKRHLATVARALGELMVLTGIGFLTGSMSTFSIWVMENVPALANFG